METSLSKRKKFLSQEHKNHTDLLPLSSKPSRRNRYHRHHHRHYFYRTDDHDWFQVMKCIIILILIVSFYCYYHSETFFLSKKNNDSIKNDLTSRMDEEALSTYADNLRIKMPVNHVMNRSDNNMNYDTENCPDYPPENYPMEWKLVDEILDHWNPEDINIPTDGIYQGLCIFNSAEEAIHYHDANLPFVIRNKNDSALLQTIHRWNYDKPKFLLSRLGYDLTYIVERSPNHHLLYTLPRNKRKHHTKKKQTSSLVKRIHMTFLDWWKKANVGMNYSSNDVHYQFEFIGKYITHWLYEDLPFFHPNQRMNYINDFAGIKKNENDSTEDDNNYSGIHCRFSMVGNMAECHYDNSDNYISILGGQKRYILSHPKSCEYFHLYPEHHESGRHSSLDWTSKEQYSKMTDQAMANEVVMQAGDILYLPSYWFHTIISLSLNYQCNARSEIKSKDDHEYLTFIQKCGFQNTISLLDMFQSKEKQQQ